MAATFTASAQFRAIDKMSKPFRQMERASKRFSYRTEAGIAKTDRRIRALNRSLDETLRKITGLSGRQIIGVGIAVTGLGFKKMVEEASKIEDAEAVFTPLIGGAKKASELVARLNKEAATTPFQFEGIAKVAQQLLPVMNKDINLTADTFRMLGDTAGGKMDKLDSITRGYTKALLKGKPDMESLNMIAEAGVPIFTEMADSMGITKAQLFEMSKRGKLTTNDLTKTFKRMTSEGGIFYKGMEISSKTFSGVMSTLRDNINLTFAEIGKETLPLLKEYAKNIIEITKNSKSWIKENKDLISLKLNKVFNTISNSVSFLFNNYKKIFKLIKIITIALASYKIALMASNTAMIVSKGLLFAYNVALGINTALFKKSLFALRGNTIATYAYKTAIAIATAVQWMLSAAINFGIWPLLAIGAAIFIVIKYWDKFGAALTLVGAIFFPWLSLAISLVQSFRKNWDLVKASFAEGGILKGLLTIGKVILDAILMPVQQLLELLGKIPGLKIATTGAEKIEAFRNRLFEQEQALLPKEELSTTKTTAAQESISREERTSTQKQEVTINDNTGNNFDVQTTSSIPVILGATNQ